MRTRLSQAISASAPNSGARAGGGGKDSGGADIALPRSCSGHHPTTGPATAPADYCAAAYLFRSEVAFTIGGNEKEGGNDERRPRAGRHARSHRRRRTGGLRA